MVTKHLAPITTYISAAHAQLEQPSLSFLHAIYHQFNSHSTITWTYISILCMSLVVLSQDEALNFHHLLFGHHYRVSSTQSFMDTPWT